MNLRLVYQENSTTKDWIKWCLYEYMYMWISKKAMKHGQLEDSKIVVEYLEKQ
jgi:hypothetical protein